MAKKVTTKAAVEKPIKEKTISIPEIKKVSSKSDNSLKHLDGLENYFKCKTKKELTPFVSSAIKKLKSLNKVQPAMLNICEEHENDFNNLTEKPKDFNRALLLAGTIISQLNNQITHPFNQ